MPLEDTRVIPTGARPESTNSYAPGWCQNYKRGKAWKISSNVIYEFQQMGRTAGRPPQLACTLREIGMCFDSILMCLTKGLGAPIGSVVTGNNAFVKRANWERKFFVGSVRTSGVIAGTRRGAIDDFLGGKMKAAQDKARCATILWEELGGRFTTKTETNVV